MTYLIIILTKRKYNGKIYHTNNDNKYGFIMTIKNNKFG